MKIRLFYFSLVLPLFLSATASANEFLRERYLNSVLKRPPSEAITSFCERMVGRKSESNAAKYMECHVTRWFVFDLVAEKPDAMATRMFKGAYVTEAEVPLVRKALEGR